MASSRVARAAWAGVIAVIAIAGCRTDVFVPQGPSELDESVYAAPAWVPKVDVRDARGVLQNHYVRLSNVAYYPFRAGFRDERVTRYFFSGNQLSSADALRPPFTVVVSGGDEEYGGPFLRSDLVPVPGESVEFDLTTLREKIAIDLRSPFDVERVEYMFSTDQVYALEAVDGRRALEILEVGGFTKNGSFQRFDLGDTTDSLRTIDFVWSTNVDGVAIRGQFEDPTIGADARRPLDLEYVIETSSFVVRVVRRGEVVDTEEVRLDFQRRNGDPVPYYRFTSEIFEAGPAILPMETTQLTGILSIDFTSELSAVLDFDTDLTVVPGDTIEVEIAPFDLEVEVVRASGRPMSPNAVVQVYEVDSRQSARLPLGTSSVVRFGARAGLHDVTVRDSFYGTRVLTRRIRVDADRQIRVVVP